MLTDAERLRVYRDPERVAEADRQIEANVARPSTVADGASSDMPSGSDGISDVVRSGRLDGARHQGQTRERLRRIKPFARYLVL
jgi:hypothetical protein